MPNRDIRVAILDNQRLALESLRQLLSLNGITVVVASSETREFLGVVSSERPNIALVDLHLSRDRNPSNPAGVEVIRELNRHHPDVGVIALSGYVTDGEVQSAREAGAVACLDKNSIGPDQILATMRAILRSRSGEQGGFGSESMSSLARLTHRELQVLRHLATGADNLKIAAQLSITERTVRAHVSSLYRKLECDNRTEMAVLARTLGIQSYELDR